MQKFTITNAGPGIDSIRLSDDEVIFVGVPTELSEEKFKKFDKDWPDVEIDKLGDDAEVVPPDEQTSGTLRDVREVEEAQREQDTDDNEKDTDSK